MYELCIRCYWEFLLYIGFTLHIFVAGRYTGFTRGNMRKFDWVQKERETKYVMWNLSIALSVQPNELRHHRSCPTTAVQSQHSEERSTEVELADVELPAVQSRAFNLRSSAVVRDAVGALRVAIRSSTASSSSPSWGGGFRGAVVPVTGVHLTRYLNRLVSGINKIGETDTKR